MTPPVVTRRRAEQPWRLLTESPPTATALPTSALETHARAAELMDSVRSGERADLRALTDLPVPPFCPQCSSASSSRSDTSQRSSGSPRTGTSRTPRRCAATTRPVRRMKCPRRLRACLHFYFRLAVAGVRQTSNPGPGDLIVLSTGQYGHVAVITSASSSKVVVIEQNSSPSGQNAYTPGQAACFLTAH